MNARSHTYDLLVLGRQVDDVVLSIFHTILFQRTTGKFTYTEETKYTCGTIGYIEVDCDSIDFTYVRSNSPTLDETVKREVGKFSRQLCSNECSGTGQISLEFYERKKSRLGFITESVPWEVWTIRLELDNLTNEDDFPKYREKVGDMVAEKIMIITPLMTVFDYLPKIPNATEVASIYDISYPDVQPYLFKFQFTTGASTKSVGTAVKKLFKESLSP